MMQTFSPRLSFCQFESCGMMQTFSPRLSFCQFESCTTVRQTEFNVILLMPYSFGILRLLGKRVLPVSEYAGILQEEPLEENFSNQIILSPQYWKPKCFILFINYW
eukprot:TRINITY_DN8796_c0_g1_i1.p2 TRINITY_DN8796_c0_g1~~TRINITY_DN8796_c0_g1_i1.p2  ORF type:complete len:106 (-),score=7.18 TRINITY_DN8796_c0_g1_i1:157-474(-)